MGLADIVRSGVALADSLTKELQESVSLKRWRAMDAYGQPTFATAIALKAVVEHEERRFRQPDGEETVSKATLTIMQTIPALSPPVTGRREPIDPRDRIVLADGRTAPIVRTDASVYDPLTTKGYVLTVYVG